MTEYAKRRLELIENFARDNLAEDLRKAGFSPYKGSMRRWHKATEDLILTVQVLSKSGVFLEMFFGFQPLIYPFRFYDTYFKLHDDFDQTYFEAVTYGKWYLKELHDYKETHNFEDAQFIELDRFGNAAITREFFKMLLTKFVLPLLARVKNVPSDFEVFRNMFYPRLSDWYIHKPRYVLELAALEDRETLRSYAQDALRPVIEDPEKANGVIRIGGFQETDVMPVKKMYEDLMAGDLSFFQEYMEKNKKENLRRIQRAGIPILPELGEIPYSNPELPSRWEDSPMQRGEYR